MDIRGTIKRHGYTQASVAESLGVNTGNFSVMIRGNITVSNLRRIADVIGCPITDFFADELPGSVGSGSDQDHEVDSCQTQCPHCGRLIRLSAQ